MAWSERVSSLVRRARCRLDTRDDDADVVSRLGEALGRNQLDLAAMRSIRLGLSEHEPRDEAQAVYLRALRDVLRAAEAARFDVERQPQADGVLEHELQGAVLRALGDKALGPVELAKKLGRDQAAITRALQALEVAGLVCGAEKLGDGRTRRRELTPHGHQTLARAARSTRGEEIAEALLRRVVDAAVGTVADVQAIGTVSQRDLEALARRHDLGAELASRVVRAVADAAERMGLVDDDDDALAWDSAHVRQRALLGAVEAHPEQWDRAVEVGLGEQPYLVVVHDVTSWRAALRGVRHRPVDVVVPSYPAPIDGARVVDDLTLANKLRSAGVKTWHATAASHAISIGEVG